jgi:hypothetical protein
VPLSVAAVPVFSWFKAVVFALLAANAAAFVYWGTASEGLDSLAWLILLVLFEFESGSGLMPPQRAAIVHGARLAAAVAIPVAAIGYALDREWLDAVNSALWIVVVAVLELQVRFPVTAARYRALSGAALAALYAGLGSVAAVWLWNEDWFSAYDALLWLIAFATIEINVLQLLRRWPGAARTAASRI